MGFWEEAKKIGGDALKATGDAIVGVASAVEDGIEAGSRAIFGDEFTETVGGGISAATDFLNKPIGGNALGYTYGDACLDAGLTALSFVSFGAATPLLVARVATKTKMISKGINLGIRGYDKFQDGRRAAKALKVASGATRGVGDDLAQAGVRVATNSADDAARLAARGQSRATIQQGVDKAEKVVSKGLGATSAYNMGVAVQDGVENVKEKVEEFEELRKKFNDLSGMKNLIVTMLTFLGQALQSPQLLEMAEKLDKSMQADTIIANVGDKSGLPPAMRQRIEERQPAQEQQLAQAQQRQQPAVVSPPNTQTLVM